MGKLFIFNLIILTLNPDVADIIYLIPLEEFRPLHNSVVTGTENTPLVLQWSNFTVSDANGDLLTVVISALPAVGQLQSLQSNGQWTAAAVGAQFTQAAINAGTLRFVPAQYGSGGPGYSQTGYGNLRQTYAAFGYTVTDGTRSSNAAQVNIDITAIATAPTLTLGPTSISQQLFDTSWEDAPAGGDHQPVLVTGSAFDGWSLVTQSEDRHDEDNGFEIWANGDQMQNAQGKNQSVQAAPGTGQEWLGLSNGVGSPYQTPGISQTIDTIKGAQYTFNFDYASQLGLSSANTQIGVYLDGQLLGLYSNTSANSLNWQALCYHFTGDGKNSATITDKNPVLNVTGWNFNSLTVTVPDRPNGRGHQCSDDNGGFDMQVVATSIEPASGSMASIAKDIRVQLLSGRACATPAGVNPYVIYANGKTATQTTGPVIDSVVASPLVPVSSSHVIMVPVAGGNSTAMQTASAAELDAALESLLARLSESVGAAVRRELSNLKEE